MTSITYSARFICLQPRMRSTYSERCGECENCRENRLRELLLEIRSDFKSITDKQLARIEQALELIHEPVLATGIRPHEGREGMVEVYDSTSGEYLGCMGIQRWRRLLGEKDGL